MTTSRSKPMIQLAPRYSGFSGAVAYGMFIAATATFCGVLVAAFVAFGFNMSYMAAYAGGRCMLWGVICGLAAGLCRFICGAETDRLVTWKMLPGDFGALGLLIGMFIIGWLGEKAHQQPLNTPEESLFHHMRLVMTGPEAWVNEPLAPGQIMHIEGPTLDGGAFRLADHKGKVVLVDFWGSFCPPCIASFTELKSVWEKYKDQGLVIVGVGHDNERSAVDSLLQKTSLPWPNILFQDGSAVGFKNPISREYHVNALPRLMLIGKAGELIDGDVPPHKAARAVAIALGQPVPPDSSSVVLRMMGWLAYAVVAAPLEMLFTIPIACAVAIALLEKALRRRTSPPVRQAALAGK